MRRKPIVNVLISYQGNRRTVFLESLAQEIQARGHNVIFYSTAGRGVLTEDLDSLGIKNRFAKSPDSKWGFIVQLRFLISFIRANRIEVVFSHLQRANLVALLVGRLLRLPVIPCRHHNDASFVQGNRNARLQDRLVNTLARRQVVVSRQAKEFMVQNEGANPHHVFHIPLGYDFDLYGQPSPAKIAKVQRLVNHQIRLIIVARHMPTKRHDIAIKLVAELAKADIDAGLIIMDEGQTTDALKRITQELKVEDRVYFVGFQDDITSYVSASDLIVHPSISESSNQVIKEAAMLGKTGVVCKGVGDFDDYLVDKRNAFVVDPNNTLSEMVEALTALFSSVDYRSDLEQMAAILQPEVKERFNIGMVVDAYFDLALRGALTEQ